MESCPYKKAPAPAPEDLLTAQQSGISQTMRALGAQTCYWTSARTEIMSPMGFVNGTVGASLGCETISVIANAISDTKEVLNCIFDSTKLSSTTIVSNIQTIDVDMTEVTTSACQVLFHQKMDINAKLKNSIASINTTDVSNALNTMLTQVADNVSKVKTVSGSPPTGNKVVTSALSVVSSITSTSAISEMVTEIFNEYRTSQTIRLSLKNSTFSARVEAGNPICLELTNDIQQDLIIDNLIQTTLAKVFTTEIKSQIEQATKNTAETITETGNTDMTMMIVIIVAAVVLLGGVGLARKLEIAAVVAVLLLVGGIVLFMISKTDSTESFVGIALMGVGGLTLLVTGWLYYQRPRLPGIQMSHLGPDTALPVGLPVGLPVAPPVAPPG